MPYYTHCHAFITQNYIPGNVSNSQKWVLTRKGRELPADVTSLRSDADKKLETHATQKPANQLPPDFVHMLFTVPGNINTPSKLKDSTKKVIQRRM